MSKEKLCACGKPLHYQNPMVKQLVESLCAQLGEYIVVHVGKRSWLVQRHYIALHGLVGADLEKLNFKELVDRQRLH